MVKEYHQHEFLTPKKRFSLKEGNFLLYIIIFTVFVFILQLIFKNDFTNLFILDSANFLKKPWMILSAIFLHADSWHIFFNMFALMIFGPLIEGRIGSKNFLIVYFVGGIVGNIVGMFFYPYALGASGAIMAILGTLIILMPHLKVLIWGIIPLPLWAAGILWFILDMFTTFNPSSNIGGIVHIAGMIFGLLFGLFLKSQIKQIHKIIREKKNLSEDEVVKITRKYR